MGDTGDDYKVLTAINKQRKQENLEKAKHSKIEWQKFTEYHWCTYIDKDRLDYWPSTRKFKFKNRIRVGDPEVFIELYYKAKIRDNEDQG